MQKVKISVVSPDYNWVICKVYTGVFHTSGYSKLLDELLATNYWGNGFSDLAFQGCLNIPTPFFGVYPEEGKRFFRQFFFMVSNPRSRWFQRFVEVSPQKLRERCDLTLWYLFSNGWQKTTDQPMLIPKWSSVIFCTKLVWREHSANKVLVKRTAGGFHNGPLTVLALFLVMPLWQLWGDLQGVPRLQLGKHPGFVFFLFGHSLWEHSRTRTQTFCWNTSGGLISSRCFLTSKRKRELS